MSPHWTLATRGAATTGAVALPAAGLWALLRGPSEAGAFLYGVGVGLLVFAAIAVTVSLLTVRPTGLRILIGAGVYLGRLVFAAAAIGVPVYLERLPVVATVLGFAGVYIVESVALLWVAARLTSPAGIRRQEAERRVEA